MLVIVASAELKVPAFTVPATFKFCTPLSVVMFALAALIVPAFTVPVAVRSVVLIVFDTFRFVKVPTLVMLGWFAVFSVPLIVAAVILLATVRFCRPLIVVVLNTPVV